MPILMVSCAFAGTIGMVASATMAAKSRRSAPAMLSSLINFFFGKSHRTQSWPSTEGQAIPGGQVRPSRLVAKPHECGEVRATVAERSTRRLVADPAAVHHDASARQVERHVGALL